MLQCCVVIILFGVAGAGKTTVGRLLAAELGWRFYDADQLQSPDNIRKMQRGIPLTDEDRRPWLDALGKLIAGWLKRGENAVLACSALKRSYRQALRLGKRVRFVYLSGDPQMIGARLAKRTGHFMNPVLLQSQFETLEEPEGEALRIDVRSDPDEIVRMIRSRLEI